MICQTCGYNDHGTGGAHHCTNAPRSTTDAARPYIGTITIPQAEYLRLKALDMPAPQPAAPVQAELPCSWLVGEDHDNSSTMYWRQEDAQHACDEHNDYERAQPDFDAGSLRTPQPVYHAALATQQPAVQPVDLGSRFIEGRKEPSPSRECHFYDSPCADTSRCHQCFPPQPAVGVTLSDADIDEVWNSSKRFSNVEPTRYSFARALLASQQKGG